MLFANSVCPLAHSIRALEAEALAASTEVVFQVSFGPELSKTPLDGRLLVMLSTDEKEEPRFQINESPKTQQIFGIDVDGLEPEQDAVIDAKAVGLPDREPAPAPPGQVPDSGAVAQVRDVSPRRLARSSSCPWTAARGSSGTRHPATSTARRARSPSRPARVPEERFASASTRSSRRSPIRRPPSTSSTSGSRASKLTKFWGRPMHLGAHVLLPEGFDSHPDARYPLVIFHGHFPQTFGGFREEPPDPNLKPDYSERFHLAGYNRIVQEQAHQFYKEWTGPNYPRMVIIEIQHANPFYDDSYAVNSANLGPYGDAITYELIPYLEKKYRCIGAGWARFLYGGSTGGWEALAAQIFYPTEYNGCYAACPDPIDFRAYTVVDIYKDKNAYYDEGPFAQGQAAGLAQLPRAHLVDLRRRQSSRAGARHQEPLGPAMGHLGGRLFADGTRRLP